MNDIQSITEQHELSEIRRRVKNHHEAAASKARFAATHCREAVAEALLCGAALLEAKANCSHGQFGEFCDDCGIPHATANRYMSLARSARQKEITEATSLRQAYIAAGIIEEDPKQEAEPADPIQRAERLLDRVESAVVVLPVERLLSWIARLTEMVKKQQATGATETAQDALTPKTAPSTLPAENRATAPKRGARQGVGGSHPNPRLGVS